MAKQIFYVFSCDEWKSRESSRIIFIGTSKRKLKQFLADEIDRENMVYYGGSDAFLRDFDTEKRDTINSRLDYGYYDYCYDNDPDSL